MSPPGGCAGEPRGIRCCREELEDQAMATLHVRDVPEELWARIKALAAVENHSTRRC